LSRFDVDMGGKDYSQRSGGSVNKYYGRVTMKVEGRQLDDLLSRVRMTA